MDNSECFGVKFVKIYPEMTSPYFFEKIRLVNYIVIIFTCANTFGHILYLWLVDSADSQNMIDCDRPVVMWPNNVSVKKIMTRNHIK